MGLVFDPCSSFGCFGRIGTLFLKPHEILWYIMIIPIIIQPYWFKWFVKVTYINFFIPYVSIPEWPSNIHKSLTIGLYFPLIIHQPWNRY